MTSKPPARGRKTRPGANAAKPGEAEPATASAGKAPKGVGKPGITPELIAAHGLKPDEYQRVLDLIGREPSITELGIFSAMWNEHCSYKSSKIHLRTLPTQAPWVIQGPGENAGVIDIGDGLAVVFKMESHNHPSYIEPYQGAATGVGGILRDVFTMGARPIACLNALSFGAPVHARTRHVVAGAVAGVGGYGNSFGVPTVGGSVRFHTRYDGNCLVNALAVGSPGADKIFYPAAPGIGMPGLHFRAQTPRRGVHPAPPALGRVGRGDRQDFLRGGVGYRHADCLSRLQDRPRWHSRRHHGVGGVWCGCGREAPDRAGRRSVRGEAAARSLP